MYAFTVAKGRLTIRPGIASRCEIWLDEECIHECDSAGEAAAFVAGRRTGHREIDNEDRRLPPDIEGWHWVSLYEVHPPHLLIC
jgi:hypothetical protein